MNNQHPTESPPAIAVRILTDHGRTRIVGHTRISAGAHVDLDLGDVTRYGWKLARQLQHLHPAASVAVRGSSRLDVRLEVAGFLADAGKTITAVEGLDLPPSVSASLDRPQPRASREDTRWETS